MTATQIATIAATLAAHRDSLTAEQLQLLAQLEAELVVIQARNAHEAGTATAKFVGGAVRDVGSVVGDYGSRATNFITGVFNAMR